MSGSYAELRPFTDMASSIHVCSDNPEPGSETVASRQNFKYDFDFFSATKFYIIQKWQFVIYHHCFNNVINNTLLIPKKNNNTLLNE